VTVAGDNDLIAEVAEVENDQVRYVLLVFND
jgi:hypothetical protein